MSDVCRIWYFKFDLPSALVNADDAQHLGGKVIRQLVSIVSPTTILDWIRAEKKPKPKKRKRGRPNTAEQIRELILLMARENQWGYTRIMGELKKLGIKPPSRNTVKKILKAAGFEPGPKRGEGTWDDFLKQHAVSLRSIFGE